MRTLVVVVLMVVSGLAWGQAERPQTPVGPFPYESIEVTVPVLDRETGEQTHTLGATVTMPDPDAFGDGPHPGVVLMSGSGMQDRDSTVFEHKPFMVISDYLTRRGIAVLRYDDRAVGASTGSTSGMTTQALAHDGHSAIKFLQSFEGVDPRRVGVMGHSEGGGHVAWIGARDESVAFLISLAGMGVDGGEVLIDQTVAMYEDAGMDDAYIEGALSRRRAIFQAVREGRAREEIVELIVALNMFEYGIEEANDALRKTSEGMFGAFAGTWMSSFVTYNPGDDWARCTAPVLALNGSRDFQVSTELNLHAIRDTLEEAGHPDYTIVEIGGLNHLFQHAGTGMLAEYGTIEETFAPDALVLIESWIRAKVMPE
ncbi:MAG: CocE/NonD family hydrolase [Phycisphaerales bacterium]